jgi:hypothetical protein
MRLLLPAHFDQREGSYRIGRTKRHTVQLGTEPEVVASWSEGIGNALFLDANRKRWRQIVCVVCRTDANDIQDLIIDAML